jgi:hypothetical protein
MSGGMDVDRFQKEEQRVEPDPLAAAKKALVKEALFDKKKAIDSRVVELTNELTILTNKQTAINEMIGKL